LLIIRDPGPEDRVRLSGIMNVSYSAMSNLPHGLARLSAHL
jgi:hypothetical protein